MVWRAEDPQGNEAAKIKYEALRWLRGRGLDLGCGPFKVIPSAIGVDNGHHWGHHQAQAPYINAETCEKLGIFSDDKMDYVFSSHLLEHIQDYTAALREWWRVIRPGGYLVLYLPHKDLYPNVGRPGSNPDHKHDFHPADIVRAMRLVAQQSGFDLLVNDTRNTDNGPGQSGNEYSFYQVYRKRHYDGRFEMVCNNPKPAKTACVVRYGGYGDQLQAGSILTELKKQGYHITFMTTPQGWAVLREDPRIDEFFLQDQHLIPDSELDRYWETWRGKFDKWINLSESIEGTLLPAQMRLSYRWPQAVRHAHMNRNYLEWTHELAEVPFIPAQKFYPALDEESWAIQTLGRLGGFIVLWALSGSSIHKMYPHQDTVIARIMLELPEATVITTGDELCQLLEQGWENEPRVARLSGKLTIRQALTLAIKANVVVGPETGILNAAGFEENDKVCLLSHSSEINLTRDWLNTTTIAPDRDIAPCHPCHQLHFGRGTCPTHEQTGAAICAVAIDPDQVFAAIKGSYERWQDSRTVPHQG